MFCEECGKPVDGAQIETKPQKAKKPLTKRWWFWVVLVFVLFAILRSCASSGSGSDTRSDNSSGNTVKTAEVNANTEADADNVTSDEYRKDQYIASCEVIEYEDVARNPDASKGKNITLEGDVIQVIEGYSNQVVYRVRDKRNSDDVWYITYKRKDGEDRILENDYITVYGQCKGLKSYESVLGGVISIPEVEAEYIENGMVVDGVVEKYDEKEIINKIEITTYEEDSYSKYCFATAKNNSVYDLDITVHISYFDEQNNLVGVGDCYIGAVEAGCEMVGFDMPDHDYDHITYEIEAKQCDWEKPAQSVLSYEVIEQKEKLIVSVTNGGEKTVKFAEGVALFFDSNENVIGHDSTYFTDSDSEIGPGKTITKELSIYGAEYTSYKFWVAGNY